jgi:small subunit ribosomal protein S7e
MISATTKLVKPGDQKPSELESQIAQTLLDLEANSDIKAQLHQLYITGAREVDLAGGKKAVILFVPVPQLRNFQKMQSRLVRELEKKFSGKHFVIVAQVNKHLMNKKYTKIGHFDSIINECVFREKFCQNQLVNQE